MGKYGSMLDVRNANKAAGDCWFDADTMRWFRSRICGDLINGRYFVTSERDMHRSSGPAPRRYTIRRAEDSGHIHTVGEFGAYGTAAAAARRAAKLLPEYTPCANCREETLNPNFTCDKCAGN